MDYLTVWILFASKSSSLSNSPFIKYFPDDNDFFCLPYYSDLKKHTYMLLFIWTQSNIRKLGMMLCIVPGNGVISLQLSKEVVSKRVAPFVMQKYGYEFIDQRFTSRLIVNNNVFRNNSIFSVA